MALLALDSFNDPAARQRRDRWPSPQHDLPFLASPSLVSGWRGFADVWKTDALLALLLLAGLAR